jgi:Na+-driven multidrug efflux pump
LKLSYIKFNKRELKEILAIGIPSALQSLAFNVSNVLIQSKVNSFGKVGMSGNTTAQQFDAVIYSVGNAISMSVMAFVGQNIGAKKIDRVKQSIISGVVLSFLVSFSIGSIFALLAPSLCGIISKTPEVIEYAVIRLTIMSLTYFLCTEMEVLSNSVRAMGKPVVALIVSVFGASVCRIAFLEIAFAINPTFSIIFWAYPISWMFTISMYLFVTPKVYKSTKKKRLRAV